jgi:tetratricopeptide (TPR) repeat protein
MAAYSAGDLERAIGLFSEMLSERPTFAHALYQRGMCFARSGDLSRARRDFESALEHSDSALVTRDAYYNLGLVAEKEGDDQGAVRWYTRALGVDSAMQHAYCNRAAARTRLSAAAVSPESATSLQLMALEDLDNALSLDPTDALAHWDRAIIRKSLGQEPWPDVVAFVRYADPRDPRRKQAERMLAERDDGVSGEDMSQRPREIVRMIQRAIEANNHEEYERALELCDAAIDDGASDEVVWDERTFALQGLGRLEEATRSCDDGLRMNPRSARLHHTKALILDGAGRGRQALAHYRAYLELAPPEYEKVVVKVRQRVQVLESQYGLD